MNIQEIIESQRTYFKTGITHDVSFRIAMLKRLYETIQTMEEEIIDALYQDLGKNKIEAYITEVGMAYSELNYMIRHVSKLSRPKKVKTPLVHAIANSYVLPTPYGVVLIMSPWNYPFLLTIDPLIDALAAGNTAVLKPSDYSRHTSQVIEKLISRAFPSPYVTTVLGGREQNQDLLNQFFDYIFFTGGKNVGHLVMEKASQHLTPVTLELGGKSPCIVDKTANISLAARRIVFGKFINTGQTCVAPDYILAHQEIKDQLIEAIKREIQNQYGTNPLHSSSIGKIINEKHFNRLIGLINPQKVVYGGGVELSTHKIEPTVMDHVTFDDSIMQEEIFGPILPVLTYQNSDEIVEMVEKNSHPLALYLFTNDPNLEKHLLHLISFGGGCINDTILHLATTEMGFGGVGSSGMGAYHGKVGFDTFSHHKSILKKSNVIDLRLRYAPYDEKKGRIIKHLMK